MFARMIELTAKAGRGKELTKTMAERSLQVLRQQQGFVDAFTLVATTDQDRIVGISIWNSKADADRFAQGQSQQLLDSYRQLLQAEPDVRSLNVESSTIHDSASRSAAAR